MRQFLPYAQIEALCKALEIEPNNVREIRLRAPRTCEVTLYRLDDEGSKYITENGGVATELHSIEVEVPAFDGDGRSAGS